MKVFQGECFFDFDSPSMAYSVLGEYIVPGYIFDWNNDPETSADYPVKTTFQPPIVE